jgi:hypothetical protein
MPFRMVFWALGAILMVPLFLVKVLFAGLAALLAVPFAMLGLLAAAVALIFGVLIPAIPLILLVALFWYLVRPEPSPIANP